MDDALALGIFDDALTLLWLNVNVNVSPEQQQDSLPERRLEVAAVGFDLGCKHG
jgi:hypothetical protein